MPLRRLFSILGQIAMRTVREGDIKRAPFRKAARKKNLTRNHNLSDCMRSRIPKGVQCR